MSYDNDATWYAEDPDEVEGQKNRCLYSLNEIARSIGPKEIVNTQTDDRHFGREPLLDLDRFNDSCPDENTFAAIRAVRHAALHIELRLEGQFDWRQASQYRLPVPERRLLLKGGVAKVVGRDQITRGTLEKLAVIPWLSAADTPNVLFLLKIGGSRDHLDRENHGFGYHYHYCRPNGARSDTMFCLNGNRSPAQLLWERHGENKASFKARAGNWGKEKSKSVYDVCVKDLLKFPVDAFRRPSAEAQLLWP